MSRAYSRAASGIWKAGDRRRTRPRAGPTAWRWAAPGRAPSWVLGLNRCRCRPMSVATATATAPAPSANRSIAAQLARDRLPGWPDPGAPERDHEQDQRTPPRGRSPTASPSRCSGPFQRGVATAPRSPASPRMISSASGSNRSHSWRAPARAPTSPGAATRPVVSGGIAPGWRLVMASRSYVAGGSYPPPPACPGRRYRPGQTKPAAGNRPPWHRRRRTRHHYRGPLTQCHPACPIAGRPGIPFPAGRPVKPGIFPCQEADFESLWVVIRAIARFLTHNDDWRPVCVRFARFVPPGWAGPGRAGWRGLARGAGVLRADASLPRPVRARGVRARGVRARGVRARGVTRPGSPRTGACRARGVTRSGGSAPEADLVDLLDQGLLCAGVQERGPHSVRGQARQLPRSSPSAEAARRYSSVSVVPNIGGSSLFSVTNRPSASSRGSGCAARSGTCLVQTLDVGHTSSGTWLSRSRATRRGVGQAADAVPDPLGPQAGQGLPDRRRAGHLARVRHAVQPGRDRRGEHRPEHIPAHAGRACSIPASPNPVSASGGRESACSRVAYAAGAPFRRRCRRCRRAGPRAPARPTGPRCPAPR